MDEERNSIYAWIRANKAWLSLSAAMDAYHYPSGFPLIGYHTTRGSTVATTKEGPMDWTNEALAEVVKESEWYVRFCAMERERGVSMAVLPALLRDIITTPTGWIRDVQPLADECRALCDEITSGRIYGDKDRCCVCGGVAPLRTDPSEAGTIGHVCHGNGPCMSARMNATLDPHDWTTVGDVRWILRARRILAERGAANVAASSFIPMESPSWTDTPSAKVDPYAAQREREAAMDLPAAMREHNARFFAETVKPRALAYMAKLRAAEKRRRVILGLERGPDPRVLMSGDLFDPRRRT